MCLCKGYVKKRSKMANDDRLGYEGRQNLDCENVEVQIWKLSLVPNISFNLRMHVPRCVQGRRAGGTETNTLHPQTTRKLQHPSTDHQEISAFIQTPPPGKYNFNLLTTRSTKTSPPNLGPPKKNPAQNLPPALCM